MAGKIVTLIISDSQSEAVQAGSALACSFTENAESQAYAFLLDGCKDRPGRLTDFLGVKQEKSISDIDDYLSKMVPQTLRGFYPKISRKVETAVMLNPGENEEKFPVERFELLLQKLRFAFDYTFVLIEPSCSPYNLELFDKSDINLVFAENSAPGFTVVNSMIASLTRYHTYTKNFYLVPMVDYEIAVAAPQDLKEISSIELFPPVYFGRSSMTLSSNNSRLAWKERAHRDFINSINALAEETIKKLSEEKDLSSAKIASKMEAGQQSDVPLDKGESSEVSGSKNKTNLDSEIVFSAKQKIIDELFQRLKLDTININSDDSAQRKQAADQVKLEIEEILSTIELPFNKEERKDITEEIIDDILGYGAIDEFLRDESVTEIMVNGKDNIYIERSGKLTFTGKRFFSERQLLTVIERIVMPMGRRIDESSPLVDTRLPDGSRVNAIIKPLSLIGPVLTIRKFSTKKLVFDDLIGFGSADEKMGRFLEICVKMRKNIVVSGGTGSGKTTLLNIISSFIPTSDRVVTIEDSAELKLPQDHVISLESRPPNIEGTGAIPIRQLVINSLRMRPDRIIVGETRGAEALDMLQAMNTGHDGSATTIHANSPVESISRLVTVVMYAGMDLPEKAIKEQIAAAVNIIVQTARLEDGSRKIINISEVCGIENNDVVVKDIYTYKQEGLDKNKKIRGRFTATGVVPEFWDKVALHGLDDNKNIFELNL